MNQKSANKHLPWLDWVRFLSAFIVLICHYRAKFFVEWGLLPGEEKSIDVQFFYFITRLGGEAVLMFFVLSGFFIMGRGVIELNHNKFGFEKYAVDRFARIMLPLVSALLLLICVNPLIGDKTDWLSLIGNLFSLQGILCGPVVGPFWSLSYEVWFYILFGASAFLITRYVSDKRDSVIAFIIIIIAMLCFTKLSPHYLFVWCIGGMAYLAIPRKGNRYILWLSGIAIMANVTLLQLIRDSRAIECPVGLDYKLFEVTLGVFFSLFIQQVILFPPKSRISKAIDRFGSKLAAFSYTLYLTHTIVQRVLIHIGFPQCSHIDIYSLSLLAVELLIAIIVAYIIYFFFEKRTPALKSYLTGLLSGRKLNTRKTSLS